MQPGDELLEVANKQIKGKPTAEMDWLNYRYATENDSGVPVTILRDGVQRQLILELEPNDEHSGRPLRKN